MPECSLFTSATEEFFPHNAFRVLYTLPAKSADDPAGPYTLPPKLHGQSGWFPEEIE